jgi:hypothetical protein
MCGGDAAARQCTGELPQVDQADVQFGWGAAEAGTCHARCRTPVTDEIKNKKGGSVRNQDEQGRRLRRLMGSRSLDTSWERKKKKAGYKQFPGNLTSDCMMP